MDCFLRPGPPLNISILLTFPLPETLLQIFLQKTESVGKPALVESLCVHKLLADYNFMHYVYRNLQNRI